MAAFIKIIYEGYCVLSSSSLTSDVRDLMLSFGLDIHASRWTVDGLPPGLQQVAEKEPQPVLARLQGQGGEVEETVERTEPEPVLASFQGQGGEVEETLETTELETPGGSTDHLQTEADSDTPGPAEEMIQAETFTVMDSSHACLELLQQASLLTSGFTEREEENTVETDLGQDTPPVLREDSRGVRERDCLHSENKGCLQGRLESIKESRW